MDDYDIEGALSRCDEPRAVPPDVSRRIYERAVSGAPFAAGSPSDRRAPVRLTDENIGGTHQSPSARSWSWTRVLVSAAAVSVLAGVSYLALRPDRQGVPTDAAESPAFERACQELAVSTERITRFSEQMPEDELIELQVDARKLSTEMSEIGLDVPDWSEFELLLAQAIRDLEVGDRADGEARLLEARLIFSRVLINGNPLLRDCLQG